MTPFEIRALLDELGRRLGDDVAKFWRTISGSVSSDEFRSMIVSAYPGIVTPYAASAAELGAEWYASQPSTSKYRPKVGDLPTVGRLEGSASWALAVGSGDAAVTLLQGAATRALFDGLRETVMTNVDAERGAKWARHASANACGFCRLVATRHIGDNATFYSSEAAAGGVVGRSPSLSAADRRSVAAGLMTREQAMESRLKYSSARQARMAGKSVGDAKARPVRGTQKVGDKYHDHCHCVPVMIRPGQSYEPPAYVEQWNQDYIDATRQAAKEGRTRGEYGAIDPKVIARLMNPTH